MSIIIKELRDKTGMTQKEFAEAFGIPVSTLRKWEQGEASPPHYVISLIARALPAADLSLREIKGRDERLYYYDETRKMMMDEKGNGIKITEDLDGVKEQNLGLYVSDMFEDFYMIQSKFDRDCRYDKKEDVIWI